MDYINRLRCENDENNTKTKYDRKERIINIIGIITLAGLLLVSVIDSKEQQIKTVSYQSQIAEEVLRFHVIANSDSEEDQKLKLKVKEAVLEAVRPMLVKADSKEMAETILQKNMGEIEAVADRVILAEGYDYKSIGVLGKTTFPVKQYGDMLFPAGEYEAFRILIGEAKGKNWWCVMFPTLCYVDEAYDVITEENKEQFREILTEEEYESLLTTMKFAKDREMDNKEKISVTEEQREEAGRIFYKCKSLIWVNKMIDYFSK